MKTQRFLLALVSINLISFCMQPQQDPWKEHRERMVEQQIAGRGVTDPNVLRVMKKVPRHVFVPEQERPYAYGDYPLSVGYGQTISQPYVVAFMTEQLRVRHTDKVLEIGTGSGYQAAVLAELCDSVFSIEIHQPLAEKADSVLKTLGYRNVFIKTGDGYLGWPEHAPFDKIIVTCAPSHIPPALIQQLREGGRMIIPVEKNSWTQELILLKKKDGKIIQDEVLPVRFVPMIDQHGRSY